ncbi:hypothetical protein CB1_001683053 [Camelus ferus]|nr:hypothetical protein CB1_001683053 [Camelus ferus]
MSLLQAKELCTGLELSSVKPVRRTLAPKCLKGSKQELKSQGSPVPASDPKGPGNGWLQHPWLRSSFHPLSSIAASLGKESKTLDKKGLILTMKSLFSLGRDASAPSGSSVAPVSAVMLRFCPPPELPSHVPDCPLVLSSGIDPQCSAKRIAT